jgi:eukaryotic-like serine/threonine-protein kinase
MTFRPPSPGVLVDNKYRLAERIGGGGMGDVFRADNVLAGRAVAIKFLHPELAQNTDLAQRFFQEAQAVNRIRHPNIVDVLDAGVGEMGPYIVMEYLEGESVGASLMRIGRFDVDASVGTAIPVLEALDAAHRAGIIHRDLKPENVFIAFDSSRGVAVIRLLDFGIAKILDASGPSPRTRTGVVFGTPDYLSPEQATGEAPLDGRSDLFAVGVLLYELLTGTRPFRAPTAVATAFKVVHAEAPTLSSTGVHVDTRIESVVQRLLQKDPARRFPTALEVIRELDRVVPDATRRVTALGRIINVARRAAGASVNLTGDSDRAGSPRDSWKYKQDYPYLVTQVGSRMLQGAASSRATDSPPRILDASSPRSSVGVAAEAARIPARSNPAPDLPRTIRNTAEASPTRAPDLGVSRSGTATPMRPFPQRFAGRYQVRGPVLRSVDRVVTESFGAGARAEIVAQMPDAYSADFRNESINALVGYELEALDAYMEYATYLVVHDASRWREIGRLAVDGELFNVVRTLLRPTPDLTSVIRRGVSIWARLFSFGAWRVSPAPNGKVVLQITDFEPVAQPLRLWVVGIVEQTARRAVRPDSRVAILSGEQSFTPELTCEIG